MRSRNSRVGPMHRLIIKALEYALPLFCLEFPAFTPPSLFAGHQGQISQEGIVIHNEGKLIPFRETQFPTGPSVGEMLNRHFGPGLVFFSAGNYAYAKNELDYVIARPQYLNDNPRKNLFMSYALYLRGMIFAYHATGFGQKDLAVADFEQSIKWHPTNFLSYLELARLYSLLGLNDQSRAVLRQALSLKPETEIANELLEELARLDRREKDPPRK